MPHSLSAVYIHLVFSTKNREPTFRDKQVRQEIHAYLGGVSKQLEFHWQEGYSDFSVSHSNLARVQAYIARQEEHHRKRDFQDELRALLRKHQIPYDEKHLWD